MADRTFATPEEAAVVDFPPQYVRVDRVSYSRGGGRAKVSLLTNEEPYLYPYYVYCKRDRADAGARPTAPTDLPLYGYRNAAMGFRPGQPKEI